MRPATYRPKLELPLCAAVLAAAAMGSTTSARAGTIRECGATVCSAPFSIYVSGSSAEAGGGLLNYNSSTGNVWLDLNTAGIRGGGTLLYSGDRATGINWNAGDGSSVQVNGLNGNADPILGFNVGTTTGAAGMSVSFVFDLPILIAGDILADSRVSYTLTSLSEAEATIAPTAGNTTVVDAFDRDTVGGTGLPDFDKDVDVGGAFSVGAFGGSGSPPYSAVNFFTLGPDYDVMRVVVSYTLTPNSLVGVTGFVRQIVVPLPAALPLLLAGLAAFGAVARRRSAA